MRKILTQQPKVPWWAVSVILLPWMGNELHTQVSRTVIPFTLKRYTDDPALIGFIGSFNYGCGLLIGSFVSLISDRIWTRFGRRRPFMLIGAFGAGTLALFIPHASSLWVVALVILAYQMLFDFHNPLEPLTMEVVPTAQRGRAGAIRQWYRTGIAVVFLYFLIGCFDEVYQLPVVGAVAGEVLIYGCVTVVLFINGLIMWLRVEEVRPANAEVYRLREIPFRQMFRDLVSKDILPLLGLAFVMLNLWVGLDQFEALLVTDQWGYSKSQFGEAMSYGMLITIAVVPLAGWISDRFDRLIALKIGLCLVMTLKVTFYLYAEYAAPNAIPPFWAVVGMGLIRGAVANFMVVACIPLMFDYVSNNRLGTLSCGMGITFGLITFVQVNALGGWIKFSSSWLYGLPEGVFNYMAGYHFLFVMGLGSFAYLLVFSHWDRTGFVKRRKVAPAESE